MKTQTAWTLTDPAIGISPWSTLADADAVARHRGRPCTIAITTVTRGDVVSTLGAPDRRIGSSW